MNLLANGTGAASVAGLIATLLCAIALVMTKNWHGALSMDPANGVQKVHRTPTPRIGGLPILIGFMTAYSLAPSAVQLLLQPMLWAGLPAFAFGLAEDLTKRVGVLPRLLATMASGTLAWAFTGYGLASISVVGVDTLLQWTPLMVMATAFTVGGVANSINIIDGFNGLASFSAVLAFAGYGLIAQSVGDSSLACLCLTLAASLLGFFVVNWPAGKLFLGDGGSYFVGFSLGWVAIMLMARNPSVNAFATLLVCIHPVTEVLFSIYRRRVRKTHIGMPDRLHFHSLVQARYVRHWMKRHPVVAANSTTGLLMSSATLCSAWVATQVHQSIVASIVAVAGAITLYVILYARMVRHRWCSPIKFLFVKPTIVQTGGA